MTHLSAAERRPKLAQATVHYTFGRKEELYRGVVEQLNQELVAPVELAAPARAGFEESITTLAEALRQTVLNQSRPGRSPWLPLAAGR